MSIRHALNAPVSRFPLIPLFSMIILLPGFSTAFAFHGAKKYLNVQNR